MKKLLFLLLFTTLLNAGNVSKIMEDALIEEIGKFNETLPIRLDSITILKSTKYYDGRLIAEHALHASNSDGDKYIAQLKSSKSAQKMMKQGMQELSLKELCTQDESRASLDFGVIMERRYSFNDGTFLFSVSVGQQDCISKGF